MIHEICLENFKPFGNRQTAKLSTITLLYGPNSGGKSSLIQALMLLRQSIEAQSSGGGALITQGEYVDLGSFKSLLHKHELSRELVVSLTYDVGHRGTRSPRFQQRLSRGNQIRRTTTSFRAAAARGSRKKDSSELASVFYELLGDPGLKVSLVRDEEKIAHLPGTSHFRWADDDSARSFVTYWLESERRWPRTSEPSSPTVANPELDAVRLQQAYNAVRSARVRSLSLFPERLEVPQESGERLQASLFPGSTTGWMRPTSTFVALAGEYSDLVSSLFYLGPLRSHPARHYLVIGPTKDSVGVRGENTPQLLFRQGREIEKRVNAWFKPPAGDVPGFDIPYRLRVRSVGDEVTGEIVVLTLVDQRTRAEVGPSDVGFGIGQLLPIIVQGIVANERVLCVEQPEIHLHPRLQAHVADLLIDTSGLTPVKDRDPRKDRPRNQWIVETHSEALMMRLQRRIREGQISCDDVSVLYVQPCGEDGSQIVQLRLDDRGEFLDEWPDGFFEESFRELYPGAAR